MAKAPSQASGGVMPGTTNFQRNDNGTGVWTSGGGNMNTPYTYNPDALKGTAYDPNPAPAGPQTPEKSYEQILAEQEAARQAELERRRSINAVESLRGIMDSYGLSGMMDQIQAWVTDGYEGDAIMALIRNTPQYKERFPAMDALAKKGRAISEAEYISFERNAAQMERAYGLPQGMLTDKNNITNLLTKEVSARELQERVDMAAAGQFQMSPEMRKQFKDYYGIDGGGLTAYFLDPDIAMPLLTRQYASSAIGAEAAMQDIGVSSNLAEQLYEYGIDRQSAREGFGQVAAQSGFGAGKGETISQGELIQGNLMQGQSQQEKAQRIGQTRAGKFAGGGGFAADKQGVAGLGSAGS